MLYFKTREPGECTGISIIDSMQPKGCPIKREPSHKVFKQFAHY
jgi:hypothetical protein